MVYGLAADVVMILHFGFIVFALFGGLLVLKWRRAVWAHLPCATWAIVVSLFSLICPLTPLENKLRRAGGGIGYEGGFIETYITPILYPEGLTVTMQMLLGVIVVLVNLSVYGWIYQQRRQRGTPQTPPATPPE